MQNNNAPIVGCVTKLWRCDDDYHAAVAEDVTWHHGLASIHCTMDDEDDEEEHYRQQQQESSQA